MENNDALVAGFDSEKDDNLSISLRKADGVKDGIIVYLSGYIDTYNSTLLWLVLSFKTLKQLILPSLHS